MRWFEPQYNDKRIIKRFPIIPHLIRNTNEVRWLETVYIEQSFARYWQDEYFTTKEEYIKHKEEKFQ